MNMHTCNYTHTHTCTCTCTQCASPMNSCRHTGLHCICTCTCTCDIHDFDYMYMYVQCTYMYNVHVYMYIHRQDFNLFTVTKTCTTYMYMYNDTYMYMYIVHVQPIHNQCITGFLPYPGHVCLELLQQRLPVAHVSPTVCTGDPGIDLLLQSHQLLVLEVSNSGMAEWHGRIL